MDFTDDEIVSGCFVNLVASSNLRRVFMRVDSCSIDERVTDWTVENVNIAARSLGLGPDIKMHIVDCTDLSAGDYSHFERGWSRAVQTHGSVRSLNQDVPACSHTFWDDVGRLKVLMKTGAPLDDVSKAVFSRIDEQLARSMDIPLTRSTLERHGIKFWQNESYCCKDRYSEGVVTTKKKEKKTE